MHRREAENPWRRKSLFFAGVLADLNNIHAATRAGALPLVVPPMLMEGQHVTMQS
jgi:hypothetical protein